MAKTFKIVKHRKDSRLLIAKAIEGATNDQLFSNMGGPAFDGFCQKNATYVEFASFGADAARRALVKAGWEELGA